MLKFTASRQASGGFIVFAFAFTWPSLSQAEEEVVAENALEDTRPCAEVLTGYDSPFLTQGRCRRITLPSVGWVPGLGPTFVAKGLSYDRPLDPEAHSTTGLLQVESDMEEFVDAGFKGRIFELDDQLLVHMQLRVREGKELFYGIGDPAPISQRELYKSFQIVGKLEPLYSFAKDWYVGPSFVFHSHKIREADPGPLLSEASAGDPYGVDMGWGLALTYDSRRNPLTSTRGELLELRARFHPSSLGSDFEYTYVGLDARKYVPLGESQILAFSLQSEARFGDAPYFNLGELGGTANLLGQLPGRYRDRMSTSLEAEYRVTFYPRLGAVLAAGVGDVAPRFSSYLDNSLAYSVGGGLRAALDDEQTVNIALDYAYGGTDSGYLAIRLGEAF